MCKATTEFEKLCNKLIDAGENYLYPEVSRTSQTDWMAHILTCPDEAKRKVLARGQGLTMAEACHSCVVDYRDRQIRKEAMQLFGWNVQV